MMQWETDSTLIRVDICYPDGALLILKRANKA
jgi:hypothetical protein